MKFHQALALIFICLKLVGEIDWSWWWVLSPFWIVFVLAVIAGLWKAGRKARVDASQNA